MAFNTWQQLQIPMVPRYHRKYSLCIILRFTKNVYWPVIYSTPKSYNNFSFFSSGNVLWFWSANPQLKSFSPRNIEYHFSPCWSDVTTLEITTEMLFFRERSGETTTDSASAGQSRAARPTAPRWTCSTRWADTLNLRVLMGEIVSLIDMYMLLFDI